MKEKKTKQIVLLSIVFISLVAIMISLYFVLRPQGEQGGKSFSVEVILSDGTSKTYDYQTEEEFLGKVLQKEKLIEGEEGEFGLFITTVDGVTADSAKQEWWCLTVNHEMSMYGIDETPVTENGHYELTLKVGW